MRRKKKEPPLEEPRLPPKVHGDDIQAAQVKAFFEQLDDREAAKAYWERTKQMYVRAAKASGILSNLALTIGVLLTLEF